MYIYIYINIYIYTHTYPCASERSSAASRACDSGASWSGTPTSVGRGLNMIIL